MLNGVQEAGGSNPLTQTRGAEKQFSALSLYSACICPCFYGICRVFSAVYAQIAHIWQRRSSRVADGAGEVQFSVFSSTFRMFLCFGNQMATQVAKCPAIDAPGKP